MITPTNITNYNRTQEELEEFLLFCVLVAGKNANQTAKKLNSFLSKRKDFGVADMTPFEFVKYLDDGKLLLSVMQSEKLGQYRRIAHSFREIIKHKSKLNSVTPYELEQIKGIGSKTSRFFVLHSRPKQHYAVLDTHILRWLRDHGINAPKSTPSKNKYIQLEKQFLNYANEYGILPAELDLQIWTTYANQKIKTK
jgi:thermostable 8-oxoguanine DNA glycosylase